MNAASFDMAAAGTASQSILNLGTGHARMVRDDDGTVWLSAHDVAAALGYSNPRTAVARHCVGVSKRDIQTEHRIQSMTVIAWPDVYRLILRSKLPGADALAARIFETIGRGNYMSTAIGTPSGREVSAAAYRDHRRSGAALSRRMQVLSHLCAAGTALTRQEISDQTGMPINAVCGRVNELLGMGHLELAGMQERQEGPSRQLVQATNEGFGMFETEAAHDDGEVRE